MTWTKNCKLISHLRPDEATLLKLKCILFCSVPKNKRDETAAQHFINCWIIFTHRRGYMDLGYSHCFLEVCGWWLDTRLAAFEIAYWFSILSLNQFEQSIDVCTIWVALMNWGIKPLCNIGDYSRYEWAFCGKWINWFSDILIAGFAQESVSINPTMNKTISARTCVAIFKLTDAWQNAGINLFW